MEKVKKIPVAFSGVMLGMAALGNLLQSYSEGIRFLFGGIAVLILVLLIVKGIFFPDAVKQELATPVGLGVFATFPMALMLLAVYAKPFLPALSLPLWVFAILLHIGIILFFTGKYVLSFEEKNVHSVWYIVYVGIVVASLTSPAFQAAAFGQAAFYFGFVALLVLLFVVTRRYLRLPVPEPAKPLMMIYAAPMALCTAGYIQAFPEKSKGFLLFLLLATTLLYLFALVKSVQMLRLPFYPSYAAFTFPFVISAIATKQSAVVLAGMGAGLPFLLAIVLVETGIAALFTIYAFLRFVHFILIKK